MDLSTVGGWVACRGAGQYSTRYGKIEDMVIGLEVALADGRVIRTGGTGPRAAIGPRPDPAVRGVRGRPRRDHRGAAAPPPGCRRPRGAGPTGSPSFAEGLEACRRILRRGATPAVLRLYDHAESARNFDVADQCVLVVLDEADPGLLDATMAVVDAECAAAGATALDEGLVERWMAHRNDVSALAPLYRAGIVVDTIEIAARWSALPALYERASPR